MSFLRKEETRQNLGPHPDSARLCLAEILNLEVKPPSYKLIPGLLRLGPYS